jgi:hypothetical protein
MASQYHLERWKQRVSEEEVADVLNMIHGARYMRDRPLPGDLEGEFDQWFEGGAVRWVTGTTQYYFRNGVTATVGVLQTLSVSIRFPDGRSVGIGQD